MTDGKNEYPAAEWDGYLHIAQEVIREEDEILFNVSKQRKVAAIVCLSFRKAQRNVGHHEAKQ